MNYAKTVFAAMAILILLSSCSLNQKSEKEVTSEIYSEVMTYGFSKSGSMNYDYCKEGSLVFSPNTEVASTVTTNTPNWETANNHFPKLERETWDNFLQVNSQQVPFPKDLDLGCKYTLLDVAPNQPMENCVVVDDFSQIGFNSSKNQALVSFGQSCDFYSCSSLYFVELIGEHWVVTNLAVIVCA